ncbi:uncharacterized protein LOC125046217 [Penaeus chinensis]|uniref:uncharacterized protein LOC125046217 n=1 Tax=Penaeus chinensis TaxID=139456 RepID=UPI001FB67ED3|nr:uncharacterized protein LOC125046217 [Penaeus chinensis]
MKLVFMRVFLCCVLLLSGVLCRRSVSGRRRTNFENLSQSRISASAQRIIDVWEQQEQQEQQKQQQQEEQQVIQSQNRWDGTWFQQRPVKDDCVFGYDLVPENHIKPLLLKSDSSGFLYPEEEGEDRIMGVRAGASFTAACPGENNKLFLNGRRTATITCRGGRFLYGRRALSWDNLGCAEKPCPSIREAGSCGLGGTTTVIGWDLKRGVFVPEIELCFNKKLETTLYSHHVVPGRHIGQKTIEPGRPSFKKADMFSGSIQNSYRIRRQKDLVQTLLGDPSLLTGKGQHYLARGHLTPDSDFVLEAEQDATYYYANAVPQWQAINNGNWKSLENSVRELAEKHKRTLDVWTGTQGVLELPGRRQQPVKVYLGLSDSKEIVPVPAYLWKVIYESYTNKAVAIVMVNNVNGQGATSQAPPCEDICAWLSWVDWEVEDASSGRTYCCFVDDLKSSFENVPDLGRVRLLSN